MKIGSLELEPIIDGHGFEPLDEVVARDDGLGWDCPLHPVDASGNLRMDHGGFLLRGPSDRVVLIDAGLGRSSNDRRAGGALPENLLRRGVRPEDVTDVVFTHLHFDHVGWATQQGEVYFSNATYRVHQDDWSHFVTGETAQPGAQKKLAPLEKQLETFTSEFEIAPGLIARPAPGHTPGSTVYLVADGAERAMLLGDVVHGVAELTEPEWHGLYDLDPRAARSMRDALASEAAAMGDVVAAAHFPDLKLGRLVLAPDGRRQFAFV